MEIAYMQMRNRISIFFKRTLSERRGPFARFVWDVWMLFKYLWYLYYRIFNSSRTFKFHGQGHSYFYHFYNNTWISERAIEIPIIKSILINYANKNILEIGNVLSHYFSVKHDILDKYEVGKGVINQDVVGFRASKKYDLIISISTLEHVGWDETPREHKKLLSAIHNLKKMLAPGGKIVATLPLGYNFEMDKLIKDKKIKFSEQYFYKRISRDNKWKEVGWKEIKTAKIDSPFRGTNGLIVGIIKSN